MNEILKILLEISKEKELEYILINHAIFSFDYVKLTIKTNGITISEYIDKRLIGNEQYQASLYNHLMKGLSNEES